MCIASAQVCFSLGDSRVKVDRSTLIRFFIVMGGFHLFKRVPEEQNDSQSISHENDDLLHPLLAVDLVRDDFYSFTMLTEAKIKDRRKSDWLARLAFGENPNSLEAIFNFIAGF